MNTIPNPIPITVADELRLLLVRFHRDDEGTLGSLVFDGRELCLMGELPWRDNAPGMSCIPPGGYRVDYLARSASGKYRDVYHVQDVPKRAGILIHAGNFSGDTTRGWVADSWGCLLPGLRAGKMSGQRVVLASRGALRAIHQATGRRGFHLEILDHA